MNHSGDKILLRRRRKLSGGEGAMSEKSRRPRRRQLIIFMLALSSFVVPSAKAQIIEKTDAGEKNALLSDTKKNPVKISRFANPQAIDGKIDEALWRQILPLADFVQTQPADNAPATRPTEVRFGYDEKSLYVGIYASECATTRSGSPTTRIFIR